METFFSAQGRIGRRTFFFRRMGIMVGYFVNLRGRLHGRQLLFCR